MLACLRSPPPSPGVPLGPTHTTTHTPDAPGAAPQYAALARSKLVLSGESYAGHYIPATAAYMRAYAPSLPLYGVAMGNPWTHGPSM